LSKDSLILVVGGGPAGLTAAATLARHRAGHVLLLEREAEAGGIPRHSFHTGFGIRDLRRVMQGPRYAAQLVATARSAGVEIWTSASVTGCSAAGELEISSPRGRFALGADAVVLCTGCRERSRAARLIPGSRPSGIMTTGTLQQLVHLHGRSVGARAVILGAEHVSYSAIATLHDAHARAIALVTELPRHQSYAAFRLGARLRHGTRTLVDTKLTRIYGRTHVEGVELRERTGGRTHAIACDIVIMSGDWVPDAELAALAGIPIDPATGGPLVDTKLRTRRIGFFAAGNVTHPAETADIAALDGRHAALATIEYLRTREWPNPLTRIVCRSGIRWVVPQLIAADKTPPPRARFLLRAETLSRHDRIRVSQDERILAVARKRVLIPNRSLSLAADWTRGLSDAAPVMVSAESLME
jgi:thioredoxin reductase